jgi:hypothetical protein
MCAAWLLQWSWEVEDAIAGETDAVAQADDIERKDEKEQDETEPVVEGRRR